MEASARRSSSFWKETHMTFGTQDLAQLVIAITLVLIFLFGIDVSSG